MSDDPFRHVYDRIAQRVSAYSNHALVGEDVRQILHGEADADEHIIELVKEEADEYGLRYEI